MNHFRKWAQKEYPLILRLAALLPAVFLFVFLIPWFLLAGAPFLDEKWGLPSVPSGTLSLPLGILLSGAGLFYALWSVSVQLFRARGTPMPMMPTQNLLTTGPFRQCRNPMLFGTTLLYLGVSVIGAAATAFLCTGLFCALLIAYVKLIEEKELQDRFGEEYLQYKKQTAFLIPRIFSRNQ